MILAKAIISCLYSAEESIELKVKLNSFLLQMKIGITGGESNFYDCSVQPFMVHREVIPNLFDIISQYFTDASFFWVVIRKDCKLNNSELDLANDS